VLKTAADAQTSARRLCCLVFSPSCGCSHVVVVAVRQGGAPSAAAAGQHCCWFTAGALAEQLNKCAALGRAGPTAARRLPALALAPCEPDWEKVSRFCEILRVSRPPRRLPCKVEAAQSCWPAQAHNCSRPPLSAPGEHLCKLRLSTKRRRRCRCRDSVLLLAFYCLDETSRSGRRRRRRRRKAPAGAHKWPSGADETHFSLNGAQLTRAA
jgi:hypothetical protein